MVTRPSYTLFIRSCGMADPDVVVKSRLVGSPVSPTTTSVRAAPSAPEEPAEHAATRAAVVRATTVPAARRLVRICTEPA
jgi:hypothetical protein